MLYLTLLLLTTSGCDHAPYPGKEPTHDTGTLVDDTVAVDDTTGETTDEPAPALVVCPGAVEAPAKGTCAVSGSGAATVLRGTILGATVYVGGALRADGGEITCVGCDCDDAGATVLSCGHAVVSPGLINAHDHVTYDEAAPSPATDRRFDHRHDWRGGAVTVPSNPHGVDGARWTEVRQLLAGTTAIFGSGAAPGLLRNLDASSEAGDGLQSARYETFPLGDSDRRFHEECDWDYGRTSFAVQASTYVPHVAEGIDDHAAAEFTCQSQPEGGERDYLGSNTAFIHGVGLTTTDYHRMAVAGTGLIWSPRSNISLYGQTAQVTLFDRLGGRLALGTDWTATGSASALRELACAAQLNDAQYGGYFTDEALWRMVTADAAAVLGQPRLGVLEVGRLADVAVFRATDGQTHDAVVGALPDDVALVLRAGAPLFGEAALVAGLGASCEAVDVCGVASAVCLEGSGTTWAALSAALAGSYPAILCGVPADEPTCHPSRPDAYDGPTADDVDGDGLVDADDLCPALFSPLRPLDQGVQPDNDGDGVGDACDETPLAADLDGDGEPNASDNCPYLQNDQADADGDDRGDVCDACADLSNPVGLCPPVAATLGEVRAGVVAVGERVAVEGTVTAAAAGFVWIQDGQTAGLRVVATATVGVGDRVRVDGVVASFFDELQLVSERVTVLGPGAPPAPVELSPEEAASEAWEGVLVRLVSGEVTDADFTCPSCTDPGLYEVGGPAGVVVDPRIYTDADWDARRGTPPPITGVMSYKWGVRLLFPRSAADL